MKLFKKAVCVFCMTGCLACAPFVSVRVQAATNTTQTTTSAAMTAAQVDKLIDAISDTNPTAASVSTARQAYDSLPMADQVNVTKYDKLTEAEKKIAEQQPVNFETKGAGDKSASNNPTHSGTSPVMLLVFGAACAAALILVKRIPVMKADVKDRKSKKPEEKTEDQPENHVLTDEEEIEKIREEFRQEKESGMYDDPEVKDKSKENPEKEKPSEDDRLTQTIEDEGDESDIQDLDDGFFTQSRFSK